MRHTIRHVRRPESKAKVFENTKITLTIGQIKKLVAEARRLPDPESLSSAQLVKMAEIGKLDVQDTLSLLREKISATENKLSNIQDSNYSEIQDRISLAKKQIQEKISSFDDPSSDTEATKELADICYNFSSDLTQFLEKARLQNHYQSMLDGFEYARRKLEEME